MTTTTLFLDMDTYCRCILCNNLRTINCLRRLKKTFENRFITSVLSFQPRTICIKSYFCLHWKPFLIFEPLPLALAQLCSKIFASSNQTFSHCLSWQLQAIQGVRAPFPFGLPHMKHFNRVSSCVLQQHTHKALRMFLPVVPPLMFTPENTA